LGFGVWAYGLRVQGSGLRVQGLGFRVKREVPVVACNAGLAHWVSIINDFVSDAGTAPPARGG